jgi:hypothetical protein
MGFSRGVAAASDSTPASAAGPDNYIIALANGHAIAISDLLAPTPAIATHLATAEWGHDLDGQQFWRMFRQHADAIIKEIIKANSAAQVIPSAEAITEEVIKQHQVEQVQRKGTCMIGEQWKLHNNQANMVREAGLAYVVADEGPG